VGRFGFAVRVLLALAVLLTAIPVAAYDYRAPILVDDEDDIYELLLSGDIDDDEKDTLVELYRDPLDLNEASRQELYGLPGLTYTMVDAIIARRDDKPFTSVAQVKKVAGIDNEIYVQLRPFIDVVRVRKETGPERKSKIQGQVRAKVADRIKGEGRNTTAKVDDDLPESYLRIKVKDAGLWEVGAAVVTQNTVGAVSKVEDIPYVVEIDDLGFPVEKSIDYNEFYFVKTSGETYLPSWPKVYAKFEFEDIKALAGSYRVGFGQRLLIDNIGQQNPYGFKPDLYIGEGEYGFSPYRGFFGAVATVPLMSNGKQRLEATPFFSWWRHDIYQSDMKHKVGEADGCYSEDPESCYQKYALLEPYKDVGYLKLDSQSFPRAWSELIGGANATLHFGRYSHVGLTGFASMVDFHFGDDDAVLTGNGYPERKLFYAMGLDGAYVAGDLSMFGEVALMDNLSYAGIGRALWELGDFVVEGSAHYYDVEYDNPHSRGSAMADQFDGSARKGELGGMLSLKYRPVKWLSVRLDQDIWQTPVWKDGDTKEESTDVLRGETYLRIDTVPVEKVRLGGFFKLADRDITESGTDEEYYSSDEPARGEKYQWGAQLSTQLIPNIRVWAYYKQAFIDVGSNSPDKDVPKDSREMEHYAVLKVSLRPLAFVEKKWEKLLVIDARGKYFEGDLEGDDTVAVGSGPSGATRYAESYVQLGTTIKKRYFVALRGAVREHLEKQKNETETSKKATEWFYKATLDVKF
jgi:hypothetical protein